MTEKENFHVSEIFSQISYDVLNLPLQPSREQIKELAWETLQALRKLCELAE